MSGLVTFPLWALVSPSVVPWQYGSPELAHSEVLSRGLPPSLSPPGSSADAHLLSLPTLVPVHPILAASLPLPGGPTGHLASIALPCQIPHELDLPEPVGHSLFSKTKHDNNNDKG